MNILFITPSLEPGKDGVGDYTLRLAGALGKKGIHVFCISLADRYVPPKTELDFRAPFVKSDALGILRLSADIPWKKRISILQAIIDDFCPDWVSLQYVPYGFDQRGLPFGLPKRLSLLGGDFQWHLMFHELWIGEEPGYSTLQKVIGWLQKMIVRKLASAIRGRLHTSNPTYQSRLRKAGCPAGMLPIFSNIPVASPLFSRRDVLKEAGMDPDLHQAGFGPWIFVLFGAIHPEWDAETLVGRIDYVRKKADRPSPLFILIGRNGREVLRHRVEEECKEHGWGFLEKGELPTVLISSYLQSADFGIATSPLSLIQKSGSVAAMLEHGLPVVVGRFEKAVEAGEGSKRLIPLDASFENNLLMAKKDVPRAGLDAVTEKFLQSLTS
jgi:glycosyltransferase involved in cell wall biosynthesis